MKFEININTVILIAGFIFLFLYFDRCKPVNDISKIKGLQALWEDSTKIAQGKVDSLKAVNDTLSFQLIMNDAAFEVLYTKFTNSTGNTEQIKKKHEIIRSNIVQLGSDDAIRLLARRAAAIDSLRQHAAQGK
jgi:hypothetical protein